MAGVMIILNQFLTNQSKDRSVGYTSSGTHRSDFIVTSLGKPVRESGSMSTLVLLV